MSIYDYEMSKKIYDNDYSFASIIMAAMRKADDINLAKLKASWPELWDELYARYHTPGGVLPEEKFR